jgi:hypothetical protein
VRGSLFSGVVIAHNHVEENAAIPWIGVLMPIIDDAKLSDAAGSSTHFS